MRVALSILALFGMAVALALFAGSNHGTITVFWPPYRVDLSLNLVLLALVALFFTLYVAARGLSLLFALPDAARRWRMHHQERSMVLGLLDALSHLASGRFIRARKAALSILSQEQSLARSEQPLPYAERLRAVAHLLAAEAAHSLQDRAGREQHLQQALGQVSARDSQETREGLQLSAARWSLQDHDANGALRWLDQLTQGPSRRTVALRLRFRAARRVGDTQAALETARLLAKHRAFSKVGGGIIVRALALEWIDTSHDAVQLQTVWSRLDAAERAMPEVAIHAAQRMGWLASRGAADAPGSAQLARQWLLPIWDRMVEQPQSIHEAQRVKLVSTIEQGFVSAAGSAPGSGAETLDGSWLTRIESAQMRNPRDPALQYLAGVACKHLQLWGKAQLLISQSLQRLSDTELQRSAWRHLAQLAEQRDDLAAAALAYRRGALVEAAHSGTGSADALPAAGATGGLAG